MGFGAEVIGFVARRASTSGSYFAGGFVEELLHFQDKGVAGALCYGESPGGLIVCSSYGDGAVKLFVLTVCLRTSYIVTVSLAGVALTLRYLTIFP